jgi:hypothetical protein
MVGRRRCCNVLLKQWNLLVIQKQLQVCLRDPHLCQAVDTHIVGQRLGKEDRIDAASCGSRENVDEKLVWTSRSSPTAGSLLSAFR